MNNHQRNTSLDLMRWVCAFLVVVIHVPVVGGNMLMPIVRIAVPFFFMITGYYLYSPSEEIFRSKILSAVKKWGGYWIMFSVMLLIAKLAIEYRFDQMSVFTIEDMQALMKSGVCEYLDVLITPRGSYGISTMWFLYCGAVAMIIFFLVRRWLFYRVTIIIACILSLFAITTNYVSQAPVVPKVFYFAFPFLYLGMCIRKYQKKRLMWDTKIILLGMSLSFVALYSERYIIASSKEVYLSTPFCAAAIFFLCLKFPHIEVKAINQLPVKVTMDIYVWHRLLYALLVLFGFDFKPFQAVVVFLMCVVLFSICRVFNVKLIRK